MEALSIADLLAATGGTLLYPCDESRRVTCIDTDSRSIHEDALFIPLAGEKFDGHAYLEQALRAGAAGCLTHQSVNRLLPGKFYIRVEDTMAALGDIARYYRSQFDIKVVGITGSVGKTTTKDMVAAVLSQRYQVLKTEGNYNNNVGVPKTLFNLARRHQIAVVEMGMNHRGEIDYLTHIAKPDVAIITNVGDAHIENLGSRENTLQAKAEIFNAVPPEGVAVLNGDDPLIAKLRGTLIHPITWYGQSERCPWRCRSITEGEGDTMRLTADTPLGELTATIPCLGRYLFYPALSAAAVGAHFGLTLEEIARGIESFAPTKMRMDVVRCAGGITVLNDTYNANPQSMRAAVDVLANYTATKRVAVLGDMLELGDLGPMLHESVGQFVGKCGIDCLVTVGELGSCIAEGARSVGMSEVYERPNKEEAKVVLSQVIQPGAAALCKASRGMRFEELTEFIRQIADEKA